ncbi:alpha/beta hydrolase [Nocardia sp. NPDC050710]|uniref:alpha/beta hydrolase n=1 Tax=Nocardia sp. NPDC050710 TaxID=3157220 RepID=UPI0033CACB1F
MSKHLTVAEVLSWKPEALSAQANEWDRQANDLRLRMDTQWRAVDGSRETWRGAAGAAMRARFEQVRVQSLAVLEALEKGQDAARLADLSFTSAKFQVQSTKNTAEGKLLEVQPDGTCVISERVKQSLYSSVNGDADRYSTAIGALTVDADAQTAAMKQALAHAADADTMAGQAIEAAFADLPAVDSFGNSAPTLGATPKDPPKNGSPEDNKKYWDALTPEEKALMISTQPASIGALDGLPADIRDLANRAALSAERTRLQREVDTLTATVDANPRNIQARQDLEDRQRRLRDVQKIDEVINPDPRENKPPRTLLMLDTRSGRQVRAAVAVGDPDTADHIAVTTPGLSTNVRESLGGMVGEADTLRTQSERQLRAEGKDDSVAAIAWIGYDPPQKNALDIGNVAFEGRADEAAKPLAKFYEGLDTASNRNDPHITALGHSYGSLATSQALQEDGRAVDDVVFYGSPGLGRELPTQIVPQVGWLSNIGGLNDEVESAEDLGLQPGHVYEMTERDDPVANLNAFGRSPNRMPWVTHLSTDEITVDNVTYTGASGHSEYPRTDSSTGQPHRSGYNLAAIVAGIPENATNPNGPR